MVSGSESHLRSSDSLSFNTARQTLNQTLNPSLNTASSTLAADSGGSDSVKKHRSHLDAIITRSVSVFSKCRCSLGSRVASSPCSTLYSLIVPLMSGACTPGWQMSSSKHTITQNTVSSSRSTSHRNAPT